ncbi:MAG: ATP-binding cassette domain-containing protein [Methanophagales archaeon]|nr:ATP-binding cassette domain-containing protein [Methanophagales archaeon]
MKYAIETENLTKKFGDFFAVDNLDLTIEKSEIFGLLGPNGAGKTTTIKMLATLLQPTSGFCRSMAPQYSKGKGCSEKVYWYCFSRPQYRHRINRHRQSGFSCPNVWSKQRGEREENRRSLRFG